MLKGVDALQYNFYKPSDSTVWNTSNPVSMTGDGNTQSVPYRVTINPTQGNVPAGTYTDTVRVIVSY